MQLKRYQQAALDDLDAFLLRARAEGPAPAFAKVAADQDEAARAEGRKPEPRTYRPLDALPEVPYVCLRLPTGGGKTILAAETIKVAADRYLERPFPLVLWFIPSDAIKTQTLEALKNTAHAYRRRLDEAFGGRIRVFDIAEFETLRPQDLARSACVVVSTIQAFRVERTENRKVYDHHEELEAHFSGLPTEGMEVVSAEEAGRNPMLRAGAVKFSFANLLYHHRPLMIVDEAHNAVSGLTREVQARLRPSAIVEFTATPKERNNLLFSVTARALRDEEMIKLPIKVRAHEDWKDAVSSAVAMRNMLEDKAKGDKAHIRPVALYQAQKKGGHPTVEELRDYLHRDKLIPLDRIKVATGEQRELDGVNLMNPAEPTRHVITIEALKEGWDCPFAYVLCATQRLSSRTAVEQLLGRVLRMPYAERRKDAALNAAYAEVSEPSFAEAAASLRDKLIEMGFTDEEVRESLKPRGVEKDEEGRLFDPDPARPEPVWQVSLPDTPETREALRGLSEDALDYIVEPDGRLTVGVKGPVPEGVAAAVQDLAPPETRATVAAELARHQERVAASLSPAQKGEAIEVPRLLVEMQGDLFEADTDRIMERVDWSLLRHPARLTEAELAFRRDENVIEIDLEGERLVYHQTTQRQPVLSGLGEVADADLEVSLVQWLERQCRSADVSQDELRTWIAALVADLLATRGLAVRTLIDWQYQIAARIRWKLGEIRAAERRTARQAALFDEGAAPRVSTSASIRFDDTTYRTVPTHSTGAFRFRKHLLGPDRAPLIDGSPAGEEFQCAWSIDALDEVAVWVRNVARHPDSFWLPLVEGRFYPDFVARLADGRIFVVEYKGAMLATGADTREKTLVGQLWARTSGNAFATIEKMRHGLDMAAQMRASLRNPAVAN